ncbi:hypothetical protein B0O99DRAFT_747664 [Bisporella sp. PMI_857]|nr:hypothetical protein B0O99DRAFT_747664 [Bisporella sp. PMI_857]
MGSIRVLDSVEDTRDTVPNTVQNIPLLVIAGICCVCGALGLFWLSWENQSNYIWLAEQILLPTLLNAVVSFFTVLIAIYVTSNGYWSITAIITVIITIFAIVVTTTLYCIHKALAISTWKEHSILNHGPLPDSQ